MNDWSLVTPGRFELPTCGLGNLNWRVCTEVHREATKRYGIESANLRPFSHIARRRRRLQGCTEQSGTKSGTKFLDSLLAFALGQITGRPSPLPDSLFYRFVFFGHWLTFNTNPASMSDSAMMHEARGASAPLARDSY